MFVSPYEWLNESVAARLLGVPQSLVHKRARLGRYGPVRGSKHNDIVRLISVRAIELERGWQVSPAQVDAAILNEGKA